MAQRSDVQLEPRAVFRTGALARGEGLGLASFIRRFPAGCIGAVLLLIVTFGALAAPLVTVHDPTQVHIPSNLVVDHWPSDGESSSDRDFLFLQDV